jgi:hypothetical protein
MTIIRDFIGHSDSPELPLNLDGTALPLQFPNMVNLTNHAVSMDGLPSLDYAMYLTNTVKFHIGQTYHLFEETTFMDRMFALYNVGPSALTQNTRMWYIQYLLIMAFGKALLIRRVPGEVPAGYEYFYQALDLFPDANGLYSDPVTTVEVCCAIALYLQAVDHRNSAYVCVRNSLRTFLKRRVYAILMYE